MDGTLQPGQIPFPINQLDDGIGWVAELSPDGSVKELYYTHQGVAEGPSLYFRGPHDGRFHSGNDLEIHHEKGMSEQFSKFDDSSRPYPQEWHQWLAESIEYLVKYWKHKQGK